MRQIQKFNQNRFSKSKFRLLRALADQLGLKTPVQHPEKGISIEGAEKADWKPEFGRTFLIHTAVALLFKLGEVVVTWAGNPPMA